jgi:hypothetical protein
MLLDHGDGHVIITLPTIAEFYLYSGRTPYSSKPA